MGVAIIFCSMLPITFGFFDRINFENNYQETDFNKITYVPFNRTCKRHDFCYYARVEYRYYDLNGGNHTAETTYGPFYNIEERDEKNDSVIAWYNIFNNKKVVFKRPDSMMIIIIGLTMCILGVIMICFEIGFKIVKKIKERRNSKMNNLIEEVEDE